MVTISPGRVREILSRFEARKILVLGDLMLDEYLWGSVNRISPEAPVPVVEITAESVGLGGAANVAHNVYRLGAVPLMVGVIGDDAGGSRFLREVEACGLSPEGVVVDPSRPTTVKTRIVAHHQHVVRADRESREGVSEKVEDRIINLLDRFVSQVEAVLIQDYNKGVVTRRIIDRVMALARDNGTIVTVDPKFEHFFDFKGITVFKPNLREVEATLGMKINNQTELIKAGIELLRRLECEGVLITRGEQGMSLFEQGGEITHVPAWVKEVFDVSGAGDTVIATLTVALAAGSTMKEAATLANYAAGVVCGQVGVVPITKEQLLQTMSSPEESGCGRKSSAWRN